MEYISIKSIVEAIEEMGGTTDYSAIEDLFSDEYEEDCY